MADRLCTRCLELQEEIRQLREVLAPPAFLPPEEWGLTPAQAAMFAVLSARDMASFDALLMATDPMAKTDGRTDKVISVQISLLRRKIAKHGFRIRNHFGKGYRLERPA